NPFDYGICGGLGFMFRIRKNVLQLDARANYSLSDIFSNNKTDFFDSSNNINFSVNLGWLWQVK
ncbi:MAG TPA: PorT family protein, partial [Paludibacteraceae bacterium]|nr:PorT family protein [Paludibacteraceae bacterium]